MSLRKLFRRSPPPKNQREICVYPPDSLESLILHAATTGIDLDVRGLSDQDRCVDASFLRDLYLGRHGVALDPRGPGLAGLRVVGDLDLAHADITIPVRTKGCTFDRIHLAHARTRAVGLVEASFEQFLGEGARVDGPLVLTGAKTWSTDLAVHLLRAEITGSTYLEGLTCTGPIIATGVSIGGQLTLIGATLTYAGEEEQALARNGARVGGSVRLSDDFTCAGRIHAIAAHIGGQLSLHASRLSYNGPLALVLDDTEIPGGVFCTGGFSCSGQIHAVDARIGRPLDMAGATLTYSGDDGALILDSAQIDGTVALADGFRSVGAVRAASARISGQLAMRGATLEYCDVEAALNLRGADITAGVLLTDGFTCAGSIDGSYARIAGPLDMGGATLNGTGERALCLDAADVTGDVFLGAGFSTAGQIFAPDVRIGSRLRLSDANLCYRGDAALELSGANIGGDLVLECGLRCASPIVAAGATVHGALIDRPAAWPDGSILEGFSYRFPADPGRSQWSAATRVAWLGDC